MKLIKIGLLLAIVLGITFIVLSVFLHKKYHGEKAKRIELVEQIQIIEDKAKGLEGERDSIKKELTDVIAVKKEVEGERDAAKEEARQLSSLLEMEKREKEVLKKKLQEKQQAALALMKQLRLARESSSSGSGLKDTVTELKGQKRELLSKLRQTEEERDELNDQLQELAKKDQPPVNLDDIFVRSELKFSGNILVVNPKYNFVIINLGELDKIPVGEILIVHRGKQLVGKVRVDRVYEKMAACQILPEWLQKNEYPEEDDSVKKF